MNWAIGIGATVIAVVVLIVIIGSLLPVAHTARVPGEYAAPPARVWAVIRATGEFGAWRTGLKKVEVLSDSSWREEWQDGNRITFAVEAEDAPRRLVVRIQDRDLPFGGAWTHELEASPGGTRLTITENGEVYNPMFRFLARFVFGHTGTLERFHADLRRRLAARE